MNIAATMSARDACPAGGRCEYDSLGSFEDKSGKVGDVEVLRCRHCGIATHWTPLSDPPHERIGINARLFEPSAFDGIEVREVDGRSWPA